MPDSVVPTTNVNSALVAANSSAKTSGSANNALGKLGSDAFLKLLVAQLKYQNPFSPSDPSAMLGQVAMFTQVESLQKIQASQTSSNSLDQARMASEVIGRNVTGTDAAGAALTGTVSSARFTPTGPVLVLASGKEMPLANMETMSAGTATDGASAAVSTATTPSTATSGTSSSSSSGTTPTSTKAITAAASAPVAAAGTVRDVVAEITAFASANQLFRTLQPSGLAS